MKVEDTIIFSIILILIFRNFIFTEKMSVTTNINDIIKKKYLVTDFNALRYLSSIADDLIKDNILKLKGNLKVKHLHFKDSPNELYLGIYSDALTIFYVKHNKYIILGSKKSSRHGQYHQIKFANGNKIKFDTNLYNSDPKKYYLTVGQSLKQENKKDYLPAGDYHPGGFYKEKEPDKHYLKTENSHQTSLRFTDPCKSMNCWKGVYPKMGSCQVNCPNGRWLS